MMLGRLWRRWRNRHSWSQPAPGAGAGNGSTISMTPAPRAGGGPPAEPCLTWAEWQAVRAHLNAPAGWIAGRFGARSVFADAPTEPITTWPYGIMRGHFGIYERDFALHAPIPLPIALACLIHLDTGMGCGLFVEPQLAVEAAALAQTVPTIDWTEADPAKVMPGQMGQKLEAAWAAVGIGRANFCAVDTADGAGASPLIVFARLATHAAHLPKERLS